MTHISDFPKGVKRVACTREVDGHSLAGLQDNKDFIAHIYEGLGKQLGQYLLHEGFTTLSRCNAPDARGSTERFQLTADVYLGDGIDHFSNQLIAARIQGIEEAHCTLRALWQYQDGFIDPHQANKALGQLVSDLHKQKETK